MCSRPRPSLEPPSSSPVLPAAHERPDSSASLSVVGESIPGNTRPGLSSSRGLASVASGFAAGVRRGARRVARDRRIFGARVRPAAGRRQALQARREAVAEQAHQRGAPTVSLARLVGQEGRVRPPSGTLPPPKPRTPVPRKQAVGCCPSEACGSDSRATVATHGPRPSGVDTSGSRFCQPRATQNHPGAPRPWQTYDGRRLVVGLQSSVQHRVKSCMVTRRAEHRRCAWNLQRSHRCC